MGLSGGVQMRPDRPYAAEMRLDVSGAWAAEASPRLCAGFAGVSHTFLTSACQAQEIQCVSLNLWVESSSVCDRSSMHTRGAAQTPKHTRGLRLMNRYKTS